MTDKHNHYFRDCPYNKIDVYRIIEIFEITDPVAQHILKKCIATGKRGHKDEQRDWEDIRDSAQRRLDMLKEDANLLTRAVQAGTYQEPPSVRYHTSIPPIIGVGGLQLCAAELGLVVGQKTSEPSFTDIQLHNRRAEDKGEKQ